MQKYTAVPVVVTATAADPLPIATQNTATNRM